MADDTMQAEDDSGSDTSWSQDNLSNVINAASEVVSAFVAPAVAKNTPPVVQPSGSPLGTARPGATASVALTGKAMAIFAGVVVAILILVSVMANSFKKA
jgi:hypothetical protein